MFLCMFKDVEFANPAVQVLISGLTVQQALTNGIGNSSEPSSTRTYPRISDPVLLYVLS